MNYIQVVPFNIKKMGKQKGMCEKNVRQGFGLPARCASAKDDMEYNNKMKAFHADISTLPKDVSCPVFIDTASIYEHIEVSDEGKFYSDGSRVINPYKQKIFGWGEFVAKARVIKPVPESKINIGDTVIVNGAGAGSSSGGCGKTKVFVNRKMKVINIKNGRYGCNQYNKKGAITGWWTSTQVKKG